MWCRVCVCMSVFVYVTNLEVRRIKFKDWTIREAYPHLLLFQELGRLFGRFFRPGGGGRKKGRGKKRFEREEEAQKTSSRKMREKKKERKKERKKKKKKKKKKEKKKEKKKKKKKKKTGRKMKK